MDVSLCSFWSTDTIKHPGVDVHIQIGPPFYRESHTSGINVGEGERLLLRYLFIKLKALISSDKFQCKLHWAESHILTWKFHGKTAKPECSYSLKLHIRIRASTGIRATDWALEALRSTFCQFRRAVFNFDLYTVIW